MSERFQDRVIFEQDDKVAIITLDRPERLNAFDAAMYEGVNEALRKFANSPDLWVAVIQAKGDRAFSAGADVSALNENAKQGVNAALGGLDLDTQMVTNKPIIAAVHGYCVGEGVSLALCCDMVIADPQASFIISEAKVGTNAVDIPIKLAKKIGYSKAFAFLTPGDAKSADWCERAGFVEIISAAGEVQKTALEVAKRICAVSGPLAIRAQKETLWRSVFEDDVKAKEVGLAMRTAIRQSSDYREGREAFLEKRSPKFKGA
ncbi:MAG: enoyl-CoA hydratase/carnithine racemase [Candidatus Azotimanducaceae bacterium]|jgi:enoyl-CoA hydratase/carnithine racemase